MPVEKEFELLDFVDPRCVQLNIEGTKKEALFRTATELLSIHYPDISPIIINSALWEREQLQNTSVGHGLAMPHATLTQAGAADTAIAILTTSEPIEYSAEDKVKVDVFFFTTGSPNARQTHLKILAELSRLCLRTDFLQKAREASTGEEVIAAIQECLADSFAGEHQNRSTG